MTAAKKSPAKKSSAKDAPNTEMDAMFGVDVVPFGSASFSTRRVLSRAQQKTVGSVVGSIQQLSIDLNQLLKPPEAGEDGVVPEALSEDEMLAAAEALEETMHQDLMRGAMAFITDDPADLMLEEWATPALSQLFNTLHRRSQQAVTKAVGVNFPTNGETE